MRARRHAARWRAAGAPSGCLPCQTPGPLPGGRQCAARCMLPFRGGRNLLPCSVFVALSVGAPAVAQMAVSTSAMYPAANALPHYHLIGCRGRCSLGAMAHVTSVLLKLPTRSQRARAVLRCRQAGLVAENDRRRGCWQAVHPARPSQRVSSPAGRRGRGGVCHGGGRAARHLPVLQLDHGRPHHHRAVRAPGSPLRRAALPGACVTWRRALWLCHV